MNNYDYKELNKPFPELVSSIIKRKTFLEKEMEYHKKQWEKYVYKNSNDDRRIFEKDKFYKYYFFLEELFNLLSIINKPEVSIFIQGMLQLIEKEGGENNWPVYKGLNLDIRPGGANVYLIKI